MPPNAALSELTVDVVDESFSRELMKMLPGPLADMAGEIDETETTCAKAIIEAMTPEDRVGQELLGPGRRKRITKGSGGSLREVNSFIQQFLDVRELRRGLDGPDRPGAMRRRRRSSAEGECDPRQTMKGIGLRLAHSPATR